MSEKATGAAAAGSELMFVSSAAGHAVREQTGTFCKLRQGRFLFQMLEEVFVVSHVVWIFYSIYHSPVHSALGLCLFTCFSYVSQCLCSDRTSVRQSRLR